jgi:hypothetical protein
MNKAGSLLIMKLDLLKAFIVNRDVLVVRDMIRIERIELSLTTWKVVVLAAILCPCVFTVRALHWSRTNIPISEV